LLAKKSEESRLSIRLQDKRLLEKRPFGARGCFSALYDASRWHFGCSSAANAMRCGVIVGVLLSLATSASATTISYTSSAAFLSALGGSAITETYEGLPLNSLIAAGSTVDGITYTSFPSGAEGRIDNLFNRIGNQSLALQRGGGNLATTGFFFPGDAMSVMFASPVDAVGIFLNVGAKSDGSLSPVGSLTVTTTAGSAGNGPSYDISTLYFVGLISDTPFTSATIAGDSTVATGFNVDNLTYAPVPIPEPMSLILVTTGLATLAARRRRKSTRDN
jgi:hypothetical protein